MTNLKQTVGYIEPNPRYHPKPKMCGDQPEKFQICFSSDGSQFDIYMTRAEAIADAAKYNIKLIAAPKPWTPESARRRVGGTFGT